MYNRRGLIGNIDAVQHSGSFGSHMPIAPAAGPFGLQGEASLAPAWIPPSRKTAADHQRAANQILGPLWSTVQSLDLSLPQPKDGTVAAKISLVDALDHSTRTIRAPAIALNFTVPDGADQLKTQHKAFLEALTAASAAVASLLGDVAVHKHRLAASALATALHMPVDHVDVPAVEAEFEARRNALLNRMSLLGRKLAELLQAVYEEEMSDLERQRDRLASECREAQRHLEELTGRLDGAREQLRKAHTQLIEAEAAVAEHGHSPHFDNFPTQSDIIAWQQKQEELRASHQAAYERHLELQGRVDRCFEEGRRARLRLPALIEREAELRKQLGLVPAPRF